MISEFKFYFTLFRRRIHYFVLFLLLGTVLGITLATILPPVYRAQATLLVESQQIPSDLAESTVQTGAVEQLQIIQQRILTRASLLEMANRLNIYNTQGDSRINTMPADEVVDDLRRRIGINTTGGGDRRNGATQATIVRVGFEAPTAALSAAVANEIVTLILNENVSIRTNVAGQTLQFFKEEVNRLDRELSRAGANILAFQQSNLNALPDSLDFRRAQQSAAQERLVQLGRDEGTLRDRRDRLVSLYERTGQVTPIEEEARSSEERQLASLRNEMKGLLVILSPQNPKVKVLQAQIAALEATVAAQATDSKAIEADGEQLSMYDVQLADLDGQLEFIAEQKEQIELELRNLQSSIEATPGNAITLTTLQRNFENVRIQYDQAVASRARAETGDTIEALAKGQRITVIEQAITPRLPESPNRPIIVAVGIGGGIVLGLVFIGLLEFSKPAIRRPIDLQNKLGITAFGVIPFMRTRRSILRRRFIIATGLAVMTLLIPVALWLVHTQVTPVDLLINRVTAKLGI